MKNFKKKSLQVALTIATAGFMTMHAQAANWLMLQGTEEEGTAPRAKVWGFTQIQYQKDHSDPNAGNAYIPPKLIGPNLDSQEQFNVNRARLGVRGTGFPLDPNVNYFLLAEFGKNAITNANNGATNVTDASITLNHIPGMRIRAGLFKTPGPEEALQAIHVFDYINFTHVSNQLMLERFQSGYVGTSQTPVTLPATSSLNTFDRPVGAFRDVGVQLFDTFTSGDWEHSYAAMIGNGNGLNFGDNDDNKDTYLYWSSEKVFGGKGPRRQGMKFWVWSHNGKRSFDFDNNGTIEEYDRKRSGVGFKWLKGNWRATVEYMKGEGMIFNGPDKSDYALVPPAQGNVNHAGHGALAEGSGYYVEGGYYIPNSNWELDLRYDVYNRLEGKQFELEWIGTTLGVQYHFNKKSRITLNHEVRTAEAVNFASGAGPNANLDGYGDRTAIQLTHIF